MQEAMQRRLEEELGIRCDFKFLFKFRYQEEFGTAGSEHEFCWVYVGRSDDSVQRNHNEIAAWRFIKPSVLNRMLEEDAEQFTPWFRMEWQRIMLHHLQEFEALTEISCAQAAATRSLSA